MSLRSGLTISFRELAPVVDDWRERTCESKPSDGVPPHVTLLFPFAPAVELDNSLASSVAEVVAAATAFELVFRRMGRFPGALYLAPEPDAPLRALTRALVERFPQWPPYGGAFPDSTPHLTVAQGEDPVLDEAERAVLAGLPLAVEVREVGLWEEFAPGSWRQHDAFPLASRPQANGDAEPSS